MSLYVYACTNTATCMLALMPASLQLQRALLPATLLIFRKHKALLAPYHPSTSYNQQSHLSVKSVLQPPSRPQGYLHNTMDVVVVKLDQLVNWSRKVSTLYYH